MHYAQSVSAGFVMFAMLKSNMFKRLIYVKAIS